MKHRIYDSSFWGGGGASIYDTIQAKLSFFDNDGPKFLEFTRDAYVS
jgi:hypothetical protein